VHFDQAAVLDPISHLLPVKVEPLPIPLSSPHGLSVFKGESSQCDNTPVMSTVSEQDVAPTETLVGFSSMQVQESVGNSVSQPEGQPKLDHF
jgi:hypothetical protein